MKTIPRLVSDEAAEDFVSNADLSDYDLSGFKPTRFEFDKDAEPLDMQLPKPLLDAVKERAQARGISYTRYIRELIERDVTRN
jgi:predicted DNA binding CopG/RHH family protein